jgi:hypothetical protein
MVVALMCSISEIQLRDSERADRAAGSSPRARSSGRTGSTRVEQFGGSSDRCGGIDAVGLHVHRVRGLVDLPIPMLRSDR